jgi:hypothetical protein
MKADGQNLLIRMYIPLYDRDGSDDYCPLGCDATF